MNSIVTLLMIFFPGFDEPPDAKQATIGQLQQIHRAMSTYYQRHGQWPDRLSDLVPDYLGKAEVLVDPADPYKGKGDLGSNIAIKDGKLPCSYSYERSASLSRGLPQPIGPFPKSDLPTDGWEVGGMSTDNRSIGLAIKCLSFDVFCTAQRLMSVMSQMTS